MNMGKRAGFSFVELMIGIAISIIFIVGFIASFLTLKKSGVIGQIDSDMHAEMKFLTDDLVAQSQGSSWFAMSRNETNLIHPNWPRLVYDRSVAGITDGVRQCVIKVRSNVPGITKEIVSSFTLSPRRGRDRGGMIKVIATRTSDSGPASDISCQTAPLEGSALLNGRTDTSGTYLFLGTLLGGTSVTCDTELYNTPYFFPTTTDPSASPSTPCLKRTFTVTTLPGSVALVNVSVSYKGYLTVRVFKRDSATNTTNPVGVARMYVEAKNKVVPDPGNYYGYEDTIVSNGIWQKYVVPGDYRVTMFGTTPGVNSPATEQRAAYDQPNTSFDPTFNFFPVDTGATVTKDYWLVKMGDASGTARVIDFNSGTSQYNLNGTTANGLKLWFRQNNGLLYYSDLATPAFNMTQSSMFVKGLGNIFPTQSVTADVSIGSFTVVHIAPNIIHATAAVAGAPYTDENARSYVLPWSDEYAPSANNLTPILVWANGGFPNDRTNIQFLMNESDNFIEVYPRNVSTSSFTFRVISDGLPAYNQNKDIYVLRNDPSNLVHYAGNLLSGGLPFHPPDQSPSPQFVCGVRVVLRFLETTAPVYRYYGGAQVQTTGSGNWVVRDPTVPVAWNATSYDFPSIVPPLGPVAGTVGANEMYVTYTAQGYSNTTATYHFAQSSVNYNAWDATNQIPINSYRINDPADNYTCDLQIEYKNANTGNYQTVDTETGVVFTSGVAPDLINKPAKQAATYQGTTAISQPQAGSSPAGDITVGAPATSVPTHRLKMITNPTSYEPIGTLVSGSPQYFPLTYSAGTFSGTLILRLLTLEHLYGYITNTKGDILSGIDVAIRIDTHPEHWLKSDSTGRYDRNVWIPHTPSLWQWRIYLYDPNGTYQSQDSPTFAITTDTTQSPPNIQWDFVMSYKPGKGL